MTEVSWTGRSSSRFISVDLPTPEEPMSTIVVPGRRNGSSRTIPSPLRALTGITGSTGCDRDNFLREQCRVIRKIGFVDHDHGFCTGRMGDRKVAFDPPGVHIMTGCRDNKYDIDVGRNDLVCALPAGSSPREYGFLRQDINDRGGACVRLVEQHDKIAHCGKTAEFSQGPGDPGHNGTAIDKDIPDRLLPGRLHGRARRVRNILRMPVNILLSSRAVLRYMNAVLRIRKRICSSLKNLNFGKKGGM